MKLRYAIFTFIVLLFIFSSFNKTIHPNKTVATSSKPNIILFFVDDLGWSDLGFRNPVFKTPNIDALAKAGINFNQAYIASPTCSPSRATLLTGQHPARLKMVRHIPAGKNFGFDQFDRTDIEFHKLPTDPAQFPSRNWLPLENTTYAEALAELGYYNLFVGKWHLGHEKFHPIKQGFQKQIGTSNFGHPKSYYPPYFKQDTIFSDTKNTYLTDKLTNEAVDFISDYKSDSPFMLTFSYYSVHSPHIGRKDWVTHYQQKGLDDKYANYAAMVSTMDESVGKVLKAVKEKGIEKETIIIFLSDQGGYFENSPLRGGKMSETLFEGGARVPFFVHWPGVTKSNSTNNSVVQSTDIFPTLVEIAGGKVSKYKELDGISLLTTIKKNDHLKREPIFGYRAYEDLYVSVREGDWKLLAYRSGKLELFNIAKDASEKDEISKNHPEKVKQMVAKLVQWEKEMDVSSYSGIK
ncbi:sulfatase [Polaribacter gangjinensis]|uniref:Sulfatase n=1 Tax=Polaribacter gangjinensis TaxID=574710 RepID=A0A2S7WDK8_9FLAO|nr:sulfatase [Polaribacter gangjinensis]PQJ75683.1 sulfatase [Polaribacter gangjinensis]